MKSMIFILNSYCWVIEVMNLLVWKMRLFSILLKKPWKIIWLFSYTSVNFMSFYSYVWMSLGICYELFTFNWVCWICFSFNFLMLLFYFTMSLIKLKKFKLLIWYKFSKLWRIFIWFNWVSIGFSYSFYSMFFIIFIINCLNFDCYWNKWYTGIYWFPPFPFIVVIIIYVFQLLSRLILFWFFYQKSSEIIIRFSYPVVQCLLVVFIVSPIKEN